MSNIYAAQRRWQLVPLQWNYNSFQQDSFACWTNLTFRGVFLIELDYYKKTFFNLWKRQKRKNVQKMDQDSKHNRELRQSPFISMCREFKCYNNNEKKPQLLKIFFILNMAPQFCQNITAVWVGPIIHSQAKTKHCLNGFSLKSSGFSQIQPQKIQLIYWNTCVFKLLIAKIILKIRIGFLEYQFVN